MAILNFILQLAGATMLLLFAVAMVRTGIERSFGASFQRMLTGQRHLTGAAAAGVGLAENGRDKLVHGSGGISQLRAE